MKLTGLFGFLLITPLLGCGVGRHMPKAVSPQKETLLEHVSYKRDLLSLFTSQCSSCHNATSPANQPNWLDYKTTEAKKEAIYQRVWVKRDMPPQGGLTEKERQMIAAWVKNGAPEEVSEPLSMTGETSTPMVSRGEYLARASNCLTCHTAASKNAAPGAGGRIIETPFGTLTTPNITPDIDTGIGKWTYEEFYRALHEGIGKNGEYLFPVFPYTFFTKMSREDIYAIYNYLKTLKPEYRQIDVNHLSFPFNIRAFQKIWRKLYFTPGTFEPDPTKSNQWNRGSYLVNGAAHCQACHSPRNFMGGIEQSKTFMGGTVDNWNAPSLKATNKSYDIDKWTVDDLVEFFRTGSLHNRKTVLGPMAEVIYDGLQYLDVSDLQNIALYVKWLSTTAPKDNFNLDRGKNLYSLECSSCHKADGKGVASVYPSLVQNSTLNQTDPTNAINVVLLGIPAQGGFDPMPSFAEKLTDQQIADIINYIRVSWSGENLPLVTSQQVLEQRKALNKK